MMRYIVFFGLRLKTREIPRVPHFRAGTLTQREPRPARSTVMTAGGGGDCELTAEGKHSDCSVLLFFYFLREWVRESVPFFGPPPPSVSLVRAVYPVRPGSILLDTRLASFLDPHSSVLQSMFNCWHSASVELDHFFHQTVCHGTTVTPIALFLIYLHLSIQLKIFVFASVPRRRQRPLSSGPQRCGAGHGWTSSRCGDSERARFGMSPLPHRTGGIPASNQPRSTERPIRVQPFG